MQRSHTPGTSIAIVRDDRIVYARGYGFRDLALHTPVDASTIFRFGSVSKQFAAVQTLMLVKAGRLSLSDPVATWYPNLTGAREIRLADILNQVTGYPDYYPLDYVDAEMSRPTSPDAIIREYATQALTAPPRSRWEYSNTNYTLVGRILERASGLPLGELYQRSIFGPLGMTRTFFDEPMRQVADRATGYDSYFSEPPHHDLVEASGWLNGAAGLAGTASDLARWDIALMRHTVLDTQQFAEMTHDRTLLHGRVDTGYGFGVFVYDVNGHRIVYHDGAVIGFGSANTMLPGDGLAVVVLANTYEAPVDALTAAILTIVMPSLTPKAHSRPRTPAPLTALRRQYVHLFRLYLGQLGNGSMPAAEMSDDFRLFMDARNRTLAGEGFARLGSIQAIDFGGAFHRGGLHGAYASVRFRSGTQYAFLYLTPANRIAELLLFP
jgi:CubicO group peptidase (beta-lactamase class C family)